MKLTYNIGRSRVMKRDLRQWFKDSYDLRDDRGQKLGTIDRVTFGPTSCFTHTRDGRTRLFASVRAAVDYLLGR